MNHLDNGVDNSDLSDNEINDNEISGNKSDKIKSEYDAALATSLAKMVTDAEQEFEATIDDAIAKFEARKVANKAAHQARMASRSGEGIYFDEESPTPPVPQDPLAASDASEASETIEATVAEAVVDEDDYLNFIDSLTADVKTTMAPASMEPMHFVAPTELETEQATKLATEHEGSQGINQAYVEDIEANVGSGGDFNDDAYLGGDEDVPPESPESMEPSAAELVLGVAFDIAPEIPSPTQVHKFPIVALPNAAYPERTSLKNIEGKIVEFNTPAFQAKFNEPSVLDGIAATRARQKAIAAEGQRFKDKNSRDGDES